MPSTLAIEAVTKRFGTLTALDDVSFTCQAGTMTGFLGPNGAGKTTTMRAIMGLLTLDEGNVLLDGAAIDETARRHFGYMPAERGLYPKMTVRDQVEYFARLAGMAATAARARTQAVIARLGLRDHADQEVQSLSSGNQQRAQLAITLVHEPDVLVMDEPFSGLDPLAVDALVDVLAETTAAGAIVLLSSHQLDLVASVCPSVVVIDHGRIVLDGAVQSIRDASPWRHLAVRFGEPTSWQPTGARSVSVSADGRTVRAIVRADDPVDAIVHDAASHGIPIGVSYAPPDLSDVFRAAVGAEEDGEA